MTTLERAVLDFTSAMHNLRSDPSPENQETASVVGTLLCGLALEEQRRNALHTELITALHQKERA